MKKLTEVLTRQYARGTLLGFTTGLLVSCGITSARAQAAAAPAPPPPETLAWVTTAAAGVTLTRGNSDTFLATITLDTKRKWEKDEVLLGASGGYGNNSNNDVETTTTEFAQGYGQYNHLFSDRFYGGLRLDGQYDGIAGIEYLPKVDEWADNYLLNLEVGIDTAINKHWSLRVVLQDQYASQPAPGKKDNDLRLIAGTAYKF